MLDLRADLRKHFAEKLDLIGNSDVLAESGPLSKSEFAGQFGLTDAELFDHILHLQGESFRAVARRRTIRIAFGTDAYFVKIHRGVGWGEIFKNLISFRLPILGARTERDAILRLNSLGVPSMTLAGFGERGRNPAKQESFLITEELGSTVSLEDYCRDWKVSPPSFSRKRALILEVARIARKLHRGGVNHRDFYLCHFLLDLTSLAASPRLHVIDLHRAQLRRRTPRRWVLKDLGGLWFSAMDAGLTRGDLLRFLQEYSGCTLRDILSGSHSANRDGRIDFWKDVERIARSLYRKVHRRRVGRIQNPFLKPLEASRNPMVTVATVSEADRPHEKLSLSQQSTRNVDGQSWAA